MKTIIVSAFPATGKTYLTEGQEMLDLKILDLDSSSFSKKEGKLNPNFIQDYLKAIKENIGKYDIILVSTHLEIQKAMDIENLSWCLVKPNSAMKHEILGRMWVRGSTDDLIKTVNDNWGQWVIQNPTLWNIGTVTLKSGEFIYDHLNFLLSLIKN